MNKPKNYLVDADILPLMNKAEKGCPEAQRELIVACYSKKGFSSDCDLGDFYLGLLANQNKENIPHDLTWEEVNIDYGRMLYFEGNYKTSLIYYKRAIKFVSKNYSKEKLNEFIISNKFEKKLLETKEELRKQRVMKINRFVDRVKKLLQINS